MSIIQNTLIKLLLVLIYCLNSSIVYSKTINLTYAVEWKSIQLGELYWATTLNESDYLINFDLKSSGVLGALYTYESKSIALGKIFNGSLTPEKYTTTSKNSKGSRYENIQFNKDGSIQNIDLSKQLSNDQSKLQNKLISQYINFIDPISLLTNYSLFKDNLDQMVIDGSNIYKTNFRKLNYQISKEMNPTQYKGDIDVYEITFSSFNGLHKKNKKNNLNKITLYYLENGEIDFPLEIKIESKKFTASLYLKSYINS